MSVSSPLKVAVAGLGTVGGGVAKVLAANAAVIAARAGRPIQVVAVSARSRGKDRGVDLSACAWYDDPAVMAAEAEYDVLAELIGGSEGPALAAVETALKRGKPVVTANKALLAHHGVALAALAEEKGVALGWEAAVAGGIPVIKALREGLAGNQIASVYGILNGTCNYILTAMTAEGRDFADVLAEAQRLGYAEADPSFDVDGVDAAHKLSILAALAFGAPVDFQTMHIEGVRHVSAVDIAFAQEFGFVIKLLGVARRTAAGLEQRVHPCMVPLSNPIAHVNGVFNAVMIEGDAVGRVVLQGRGAGEGPTASAVVGDLVDIARGTVVPAFGAPVACLAPIGAVGVDHHVGRYYIRLMVADRPGVVADVTAALRDEAVSIESLLQRGRHPNEAVPLVMVTHEVEEAKLQRALDKIANLDVVAEPPRLIRIIETN